MRSESGRVVAVTGASRGLGLALVRELAHGGCRVAACARSIAPLEALAPESGEAVHHASVDVADDAAVGRWVERVLAEVGVPELVVNNAGRINGNAPLWNVPPGEFSEVLDVNVKGTYSVIRHFAPAMLEAGRGVFANFSSGWGRSTSPDVAPYCASKWAIEGLTAALAQELPRGLAAVAVNPGVIHTQMLESCFGGGASSYPSAEAWAPVAASFLLRLGPRQSGTAVTIPPP